MMKNLEIVSTNEVMEFVSLLKDVPAEVALEALAQYPEFVKMIKETTGLQEKLLSYFQENADQCFLFYQEILNDISQCLEKESLTYEQKMNLIEKEIEVARIVGSKETEMREAMALFARI